MNSPLLALQDRNETVAMSELLELHSRHLRAAGRSDRTITDRAIVLRSLHEALPFGLAYAGTDELESWLQHEPSWSGWTRSTYAMHIRGFYRWADGRYLEGDPSADMARPRKPESVPNPVTDAELAHALGHSPEPWHTAIMLAAYAGLRVSEIAGVRREDINEHSIRIRRAKGGNAAAVDTHPNLWKMARSRPAGPLAARAGGGPVTGRWISRESRKLFDSIGLPEVTMHRFRHWFGTALLESGADIRTVQTALRHKSLVSTEGYTLVRGGQRRLAIRSLPTPTENPAEGTR